MSIKPQPSLNGLRVLVTRASSQAKPLCDAISQSRGIPLHYPMLELQATTEDPSIAQANTQLPHYDKLIFISANAVKFAFAVLDPNALNTQRTQLACVGQQTANTLAEQGYTNILRPEQDFSSEGLLSLSAFKSVQGQRILIVRGKGGRELLKQTLEQRGAKVDYLECYQRLLPNIDFAPLEQLICAGDIDVISCSSNQALDNLLSTIQQKALFEIAFLPISTSMATKAKQAGFKHIINTANNASDEAILESLCQFQHSKQLSLGKTMSDKPTDQSKSPATVDTQTKAKPSKAAAKPTKAPGSGMAKFLALVAILITLAACALGYQQLLLIKQQLAEQEAKANSAQPADKQFDTFKQNLAKRLDSFKDQQHLLQGKIKTLENAISAAASEANRDQRGWVLAEAEYLMNMANARLRLLRDVKSAIEALKGADQRIASLADPSLFPVQEALADEISNLQAIGIMDSNSVALKLINLGKLVRKMPPAQVILGSEKVPADEEANVMVASFLNKIGLQKNQRAFDARPTQVDILNMDQKILLDLDAARHAVLRFDPKTYAAHIKAALQTLEQHYDSENPQVQTLAEELRSISSRNIFPALPDISQSSSLLNTLRNRYTPVTQTGPAQEQTL